MYQRHQCLKYAKIFKNIFKIKKLSCTQPDLIDYDVCDGTCTQNNYVKKSNRQQDILNLFGKIKTTKKRSHKFMI